MENQNFFLAHWIILFAAFVTIVYIITAICKGKLSRDSLVNVFTIFLSAGSIVNGIKLICHTLTKNKVINDLINLEDSELLYTIAGGFVVAWIALWELIKQFKKLNNG